MNNGYGVYSLDLEHLSGDNSSQQYQLVKSPEFYRKYHRYRIRLLNEFIDINISFSPIFLYQIYSWGRGHPEEYTEAINFSEERFDSIDSDKKPRAGQILWIRGLTRLQTQVSTILIIKMIQNFKGLFLIL